MKKHLACLLPLVFIISINYSAFAQSVPVTKTNSMKVYMHYMPWFDAPINPVAGTNYNWGYHWKMNTRNPNIIDANGHRQIASHYYPLIGPYASKDPDVIEYHLLLMKLSGIDGILIDWYGQTGSNGDIKSLLTNSDSLINRTGSAGMDFGLITEDRFWRNITDAKNGFTYIKNNYFNKSNYLILDTASGPFVGIFGPVTFRSQSQWTDILSVVEQPIQFVTLNNHSNFPGNNADGEYMWVYNNFINGLNDFYNNKAPNLKFAMGGAYPRFHDYYAQGGAGNTLFTIPDNNGKTLDTTLALIEKNKLKLDAIQLITFNDFGEGTVFEPTIETGFKDLVRIQQYTGVPYTQADLEEVYRLHTLRKKYAGETSKQNQLNQVFNYFTTLKIDSAVALMNGIENISANAPLVSVVTTDSPSENGATGSFTISATNASADVIIKYSLSGTATAEDYNAIPALTGTVLLTVANPSATITITAIDDILIDPKETLTLTITEDTSYRISKPDATLIFIDNEVPPCAGPMIINTNVAPVIDGAEDIAWSRTTAIPITKTVNGILQNDYAASWKAMYDNDYLYVLVQVKDSALKNNAALGWENDAVEIYIDGKNEKRTSYDNNDFQFGFRWGIKPDLTEMYGSAPRTGIVYAIPSVVGGYNLEVKIPWSTINGGAPSNGKEIGFDIEINDNDRNSTRQATAGWFATVNNAYNNPSVFGTVPLTICTGDAVAAAPIIINPDSISGAKDSIFNFAIIAANSATSYQATGLPTGLIINTSTGLISGTPTEWGNFIVLISATNGSGNDDQTLTLHIADRYPVRFLSAGTVYQDTIMIINWSADSSVFVTIYEIEHSNDGIHFNGVQTVSSTANNSNDSIAYTTTDPDVTIGDNYYRIKAVLTNGQVVYSNIVKALPIIPENTATTLVKLYPNPLSGGQLQATFFAGSNDNVKVRLVNSIGQQVYTTTFNINMGTNTYSLPVPVKLSAGYYQLEFRTGSGARIVKKLIMQ